jgi:hypothetical protein
VKPRFYIGIHSNLEAFMPHSYLKHNVVLLNRFSWKLLLSLALIGIQGWQFTFVYAVQASPAQPVVGGKINLELPKTSPLDFLWRGRCFIPPFATGTDLKIPSVN